MNRVCAVPSSLIAAFTCHLTDTTRLEALAQVSDPRSRLGRWFALPTLIVLDAAFVCRRRGRRRLPAISTLQHVFCRLDADESDTALDRWIAMLARPGRSGPRHATARCRGGRQDRTRRQEHRGSPGFHLLAAIEQQHGLVLARGDACAAQVALLMSHQIEIHRPRPMSRRAYACSMVEPVRMTRTTREVLRVLLNGTNEDLHGLRICQEAGLGSGTTYPILSRLERAGWVEAHWEDETEWLEPADGKRRPRRRYYRLTGDGLPAAVAALAPAKATARRPGIASRAGSLLCWFDQGQVRV